MAQNDTAFEQLKQKYQTALNLMQQLQVRVMNINMQGPRLLIRGEAPSGDAKNRVWDQIKLIDASYSDLICDLSISQQQPAGQTMTAGGSISGGHTQRRYIVKPGDSLSKISRDYYGDSSQYMKIFDANRRLLEDPNKISPGQDLVIPE